MNNEEIDKAILKYLRAHKRKVVYPSTIAKALKIDQKVIESRIRYLVKQKKIKKDWEVM